MRWWALVRRRVRVILGVDGVCSQSVALSASFDLDPSTHCSRTCRTCDESPRPSAFRSVRSRDNAGFSPRWPDASPVDALTKLTPSSLRRSPRCLLSECALARLPPGLAQHRRDQTVEHYGVYSSLRWGCGTRRRHRFFFLYSLVEKEKKMSAAGRMTSCFVKMSAVFLVRLRAEIIVCNSDPVDVTFTICASP